MSEKRSEKRQEGATNAQKVTVKANEFVLVDKDNNVRGAFGMDPDNQPQLVLLSGKKTPWFTVNVCDNAPAMWLFDKEGQPRFELHLDEYGDEVTLSLKDSNGVVRVLVGMSERGSSHLVLHDPEDRMRAVVAHFPSRVSTKGTSKI